MSGRRMGAWLELVRVSNFPTVVSNALAGCAMGMVWAGEYPWRAFGLAAPALVLIYGAGMALNDALDADVDGRERPGRPIPSGRVSRRAALVLAGVCAMGALGLLAWAGPAALLCGMALGACAVLYDLTHRAHAATVVLMGGCRALALITAAAAVGWPPSWEWLGPAAAAIWVYVVALSVVARGEAGNRRRIRLVVSLVCGISMLDAAWLAALGRWPQAALAVGCFVLALAGQRRVLGS